MKAVAKYKNCPISARKMRLVADTVRGLQANKALDILKFTRRDAAKYLEKTVASAVANWSNKTGLEPDDYDLYIETLLVDEAPMLKRFRPAPFGRAHRIRKRSNHITVVVTNRVDIESTEDAVEFEETQETTNE